MQKKPNNNNNKKKQPHHASERRFLNIQALYAVEVICTVNVSSHVLMFSE